MSALCASCRQPQAPQGKDRVKRFWALVARAGANECWEWQGARDAYGYGQFRGGAYRGRRSFLWKAHRFAAVLAGWNLAGNPDLQVCHSCDNPRCVNPAHLRLDTQQSNMDDRQRRGRWGGRGPARA